MAIGTPFHSRTSVLNTSLAWKHWSGYYVAVTYEDFNEPEYQAIRNGAALMDIHPFYKYDVKGKDAEIMINRLITRDASKCRVGQALYTSWCDDDGKVIQDGIVQRLEQNHFRVSATDPCVHWFYFVAQGLDVAVDDVSESIAALALQGPQSRNVLAKIASTDIASLRFFHVTATELGGVPVIVSRTGYTGDLGYEIWVAPDDAERLWDVLWEAGKGHYMVPAGMGALDLARIEAGLPLIETDFWNAERVLIPEQKSTPYEIGLGWAVNLKKPYFIGREALIEEQKKGPAKLFMGLEISWPDIEPLYKEEGLAPEIPQAASRVGVPVYFGGRQVGKATSSCWSKLLKKFLALATLDAAYAKPGTHVDLEMTVEYKRKRASAKVVPLPFFDPERKRA